MVVRRIRASKDLNEIDLETGPLLAGKISKRRSIMKRLSNLFKNAKVGSESVQRSKSKKGVMKDYNWWTKYYKSLDEIKDDDVPNNKHRLIIYPSELESQTGFNRFQDWADTIPLHHGLDFYEKTPHRDQKYGHLKASIEFQKLEGMEHILTGTRTSLVGPFSKYLAP